MYELNITGGTVGDTEFLGDIIGEPPANILLLPTCKGDDDDGGSGDFLAAETL